jgi:hypothetical protein
MLWMLWHERPAGARFTFDCYRHWPTLVIHGKEDYIALIYSKEGVT